MSKKTFSKVIALCCMMLMFLNTAGCGTAPKGRQLEMEDPAAGALEGISIVLDAGHGGFDGGAVGRETGVREDALNLEVCEKLAELLRGAGARVVMTREGPDGLNDPNSPAKGWKREDMNKRFRIIRDSGAHAVISIHMNKFPQRSVWGAQVFYQKDDEIGQLFAERLQHMLHTLPEAGKRIAKSADYMVLKAGVFSSALVECGFLSNAGDESLLKDEVYQYRLAWCLYAAVVQHFALLDPAQSDIIDTVH